MDLQLLLILSVLVLGDSIPLGPGDEDLNARCPEGRYGPQCQCYTDELWTEDPDATCRRGNGTDICSNHGDCVCGDCECRRRENPDERYYGQYCECDNFNCDRSNNKLCGGHGRCECGECICDRMYTGSACDCSLDTSACLAKNGQICNGRGLCLCGVCKCTDPFFQGPTCEICPACTGFCTVLKACVQCRAFNTGEKKDTCEQDCSHINLIKVKDRGQLPQRRDFSFRVSHCKERDDNDCWFYYTYAIRNGTKEIHVAETLDGVGCKSTSFVDKIAYFQKTTVTTAAALFTNFLSTFSATL